MTKLCNHALLQDPAAQRVLLALDSVQSGCARLVGGCVRDAVLGRHAHDVDIATQLEPQAVIGALQAAGIKTVPTGLAHGTITAIVNSRPVEVTTLRRDVATDGRHAEVAFTTDWHQDASRRDFTMNALYCDMDGTLFDPTGTGIEDARAGRVRFVGDPDLRVREDYLRILRFFRFHAWYGKGPPDENGQNACARHLNGMATLSAERVWMELKRLFGAPDPRSVLVAMIETGVLAAILPEAMGVEALQQTRGDEQCVMIDLDPMQRLMVLLPRNPAQIAAFIARLKLSNAEGERLLAWAKDQTMIQFDFSDREVRQTLYWLGKQLFLDRIFLAWAHDFEVSHSDHWRAMIALAREFVVPRFPVTGQDVLNAGARPDPRIGHILGALERWWVEHDFINDDAALQTKLASLVNQA
ncbi:CCA tRNA nucleotidyltransferase [Candidatus Phycosocius spiralis]|uniref:Poly(A) polymerase n=1 Tax=Candidatus Phycosocius spiralis TaxID=2815099 RepID=A0ABQ4PTJ9_9PROT|nr:CCA tRNA nucleotidyltransferase [Candidatus Phycosocius spiralis]GIU66341.1 poly(A) polymerase [Candidatus Phycosocius spiralis]